VGSSPTSSTYQASYAGEPGRKEHTMDDTKIDTSEEEKILDEMTPEQLGKHIRELIHESRRSRRHRTMGVRKGDLKALAAWERELTNNYGVKKVKKP